MATVHDFTLIDIDGNEQPMADFKDQVLLIVNVASECGLTDQYQGLQQLYESYEDKGFSVLGIPCNQFGAQEPGSDEAIKAFCSSKYSVTFPMFSKIKVNGPEQHPLYAFLTNDKAAYPGEISWNFEKFLISKTGNVIARFEPRTPPVDPSVTRAIEDALA